MALWRILSLVFCSAALAAIGYKLLQSPPTTSLSYSSSATPFITPMPSPGTVFPTSDGYIGREASPPESWDVIRNSPPTVSLMTEPHGSAPYLRQQIPDGHYDILRRAVFQFNVSTLPKTPPTITAHLEVYVNSFSDTLGDQAVIVTSLASQNTPSLSLSDPVLLKNITSKSVLTLPFNAKGLAYLQSKDQTELTLVFQSDHRNTEPSWLGQQQEAYLNLDFVEGVHPPRLVTSHASSP